MRLNTAPLIVVYVPSWDRHRLTRALVVVVRRRNGRMTMPIRLSALQHRALTALTWRITGQCANRVIGCLIWRVARGLPWFLSSWKSAGFTNRRGIYPVMIRLGGRRESLLTSSA